MGFERCTGLQLLVAGIWVRRGYHLPLPEGLPPEYSFLEEEDFVLVYPTGFDVEKFLSELRKARAWLNKSLEFHREWPIQGIVYREEDRPDVSAKGIAHFASFEVVCSSDFPDVIETAVHELAHILICYHPLEEQLDAFCSQWCIADWGTPQWKKRRLRFELEEALVRALTAEYFKKPLEFGTSQRLSIRKGMKSRWHENFLPALLILAQKTSGRPIVKIASQLLEVLKSGEDPDETMGQFFATILPRRFRRYLREEHRGHGRWRYTVQPGPVQPEG
jgi:hypothetical protein